MNPCICIGLFLALFGTCINSTDNVPAYVSLFGLFVFCIGVLQWNDKRKAKAAAEKKPNKATETGNIASEKK